MSTFLGLLGIVAFFVGIIMVVINLFKKKPKRNPVIVIFVGLALFIVGVSLSSNNTASGSDKTVSTAATSKKLTNDSSSKAKASFEAAEISKSKEAEIKASKEKAESAKKAEEAKRAEEARQIEASRQAEQSKKAEAQSIAISQSNEIEASKQVEAQRQAEAQAATQQAQADIATTETENNRTVYVVDNGKTSVYWYNDSAIHPAPKYPVISMTESEALARGLHHSKTE
ncbi:MULTISPECIES: hypothetical protein [Lactococcus]|uniref:hypothetical protein n=1 Tax=Lactococcus TaxID=1357 RepID=UPI001A8C3BF8|nr:MULTISPECIES: hypothetical protein [Lactococcus]MCH1713577.1 hypothetical protein [Lactococcus petauri]QSR10081.1 hypothetical protein JZX84_06530 [Lactococcus sp. LG592]